MTPEGRVMSAIRSFLDAEFKAGRCYYERRQAIGYDYRKGTPDIWFVKQGKHYEVEVKKPNGVRSTLQYRYEEILKNVGCIYACVDSFADFLELYEKDPDK